jgi:transposase
MSEDHTLRNERLDDVPVLLAQLDKLQIAALLDKHFPTHGNWQGLSLGTVTSVWLSFIVSQANHRLSHVQGWAAERLTTLKSCLGQEVRALDFSDDRLALVLDYLSDDEAWDEFECSSTKRTLRVYELRSQRVRIDSSTAKGYGEVTEGGLFQFGHSKDHRPDLPQVKINLSALDPIGLPLTTTVVSGERADDPLYVPEIKRVQQALGRRGVTYIGDSKMAALATRAYVADSGDYYLCPLRELPAAKLTELLAPVWTGEQALTAIYGPEEVVAEQIAEGFELAVPQSAELASKQISWLERRLLVRSLKLAERQQHSLQTRLARAVAAIEALNRQGQGRKRWRDEAELRQAAEQLLDKQRVMALVSLQVTTHSSERVLRRYGHRPAEVRQEHTLTVTAHIDQAALVEAERVLGWRVYLTNQSAEQLSLAQAVLAYRAEYLIERDIARLKGQPLSLSPMYLQSDERVKGLIRLLTIGLRLLTLLEFCVRRELRAQGSKLSGIYPGNPKRVTATPTAEMMLKVFTGLSLTLINQAGKISSYVTPLNEVQTRILMLFGFPPELYSRLVPHSLEALLELSER